MAPAVHPTADEEEEEPVATALKNNGRNMGERQNTSSYEKSSQPEHIE